MSSVQIRTIVYGYGPMNRSEGHNRQYLRVYRVKLNLNRERCYYRSMQTNTVELVIWLASLINSVSMLLILNDLAWVTSQGRLTCQNSWGISNSFVLTSLIILNLFSFVIMSDDTIFTLDWLISPVLSLFRSHTTSMAFIFTFLLLSQYWTHNCDYSDFLREKVLRT